MVQRDFNFAIVDEVDSILIDEARTPLIISGPAEDQLRSYYVKAIDSADPAARRGLTYEKDEKHRASRFTEDRRRAHVEHLLIEGWPI